MSRAANNTVVIPDEVRAEITGNTVSVEGSNGKLSYNLHPLVRAVVQEKEIKIVAASGSNKILKMLIGTTRALLQNILTGVSKGFERRLEIVGVGYRAQVQGRSLNLSLGFSHLVNLEIPEGISIETPSNTEIVIKGNDKQKVGQLAANIRSYRLPEPYNGKGVRYLGEQVIRKEVKKS